MSDSLPRIKQCAPYKMEVEEGKLYSWCRCGLSSLDPLCDGSHKGTDFKSFKFIAEKTGTVWLCGCKETKNMPFCDGTHTTLSK